MAKKKGNEGWWIAGLLIAGVSLLYYSQTGLEKEHDSALIPNTIEGKIDALIAALKDRFGPRWVNFGVYAIQHYVQSALPASLVALVGIVVTVENMSKARMMTSYEKQQRAVQMARGR